MTLAQTRRVPGGFLTIEQVLARVPLTRAGLRRVIAAGQFPQAQKRLGSRALWSAFDVQGALIELYKRPLRDVGGDWRPADWSALWCTPLDGECRGQCARLASWCVEKGVAYEGFTELLALVALDDDAFDGWLSVMPARFLRAIWRAAVLERQP